MSEKSKASVSYEKFKTMCETNPDQARAVLKDQFGLTPAGLRDCFSKKNELSSKFFSDIVGRPINIAEDGDVTVVLEKCLETPETVAKTMHFLFSNFIEREVTPTPTPAVSAENSGDAPKKKTPPAIRQKQDWSVMSIPFNEGTKQYVAFKVAMEFDWTKGTREQCFEMIVAGWKAAGVFDPKSSPATVLDGAVTDARKRGWIVEKTKTSFSARKAG